MAITRTAKGTASAKASGTTLTVADVALTAGQTLIVGVAFDNSQGEPVVTLRNKELHVVAGSKQANAGTGFSVMLFRKIVHKTGTRDVTATWGAAIGARAMFVTAVDEASIKDVGQKNEQDGTGAPATGTAVTSTAADTISVAAFASVGPSSDTAGTAGAGHTLGQRVGTTGAPPVSNVTIQETFEILSATGNIRATLSGATSRDWASTIVALSAAQAYTVVDAYENLRITDNDANQVVVLLESETTGDFVAVRLDPEDFDALSDVEVTEKLRQACTWHVEHRINNELVHPSADSTRDTRLATFVNDVVTV